MSLFGPIFPVEMFTSARRPRYFVVRVLYALALFGALAINYSESRAFGNAGNSLGQAANIAGRYFYWFSQMQLLMVLMVGPAIAAGTIAMERERRTIEYLFATDLTNREIVLGKLTARLIQIGYLVLAGLPILALAMLMGGIAPEQLAASFIITLSTMITVAVLAVAVSVWAPRVREAITRVYIILFALMVVPGMMVPLFRWLNVYDWISLPNDALLAANPFTAFAKATWFYGIGGRGASNVAWGPVWEMLTAQGISSALLVTAATWGVRRVHLREAGKAPPKEKRVWGARRRRRKLGENSMLWKEMATARAAGKLGIFGRVALWLIVGGILVYSLFWFVAVPMSDSGIGSVIATDFLACGALLLVAGRAAGAISNERERDTWVTLLSTPLSAQEIVLGKILGSIYALRWGLLLLGLIWLLQTLRTPSFFISVPVTLLVLTIIAFFAAALGTNYSLRCTTSTRAFGATLATAVFVGGGYLFCCIPFMVGSGGQIVLSPCVPFLLACPGMVSVENHTSREEWIFPIFGLGCLIYAGAGFALYQSMIASFDRINGRVDSAGR